MERRTKLSESKRLLSILKKDAYMKKRITLASGRTSDFYIDVRKVHLTPEGLSLIVKLIWPLIKKARVSAVGGPTSGADPIVAGICLAAYRAKIKLNGFFVRKEPKGHGRCQMVEGPEIPKGSKVVIIDDVATSGGSLLKTIKVLQDIGLKVVLAITVVDRQEGAKEALEAMGVPLLSLFMKSDFLRKA